jgi:branched-chain amino acid aminotransferase
MIHRFVFHNDRLLPIEQVRLSPGQSGLLSGWGLFTTIRIVEGIPFAFERHWRRLQRDAVRTDCPFPFEEEAVQRQLAELLHENQVRQGCARIYMIYNYESLWRGDEPLPQVDLLICSAGLPSYRDFARLTFREHGRHAASPLAGVKVTSWLNNVWNLHEAHRAGFDEVILLNERGEVAECTAANIFCVRDGKVLTPPLASGCLAGITREVLLEIGEGAGIPVEEKNISPEDLYGAEEVFISSTNRNLLPVAAINDRKIAKAPGPVIHQLEKTLENYIRRYIDARVPASSRT